MKEDGMGGVCGTMGGMSSAYKISVGQPKGKRPLGEP
jgi:hypothetical protein